MTDKIPSHAPAPDIASALRALLAVQGADNVYPAEAARRAREGDAFWIAIQRARAALAAAAPAQAPAYCWAVSGCSHPFFGLYAEDDARMEARRIGGTAEAFPLYRGQAPAPAPAVPAGLEAIGHIDEDGRLYTYDNWTDDLRSVVVYAASKIPSVVAEDVTEDMMMAGARSLIDGQEQRPGTSWADEARLAYLAMRAAAPQAPQQSENEARYRAALEHIRDDTWEPEDVSAAEYACAVLNGYWHDDLQAPQQAELTDEQIDYIADKVVKAMPEGISGFLKVWGWQQFARELLDVCGVRPPGMAHAKPSGDEWTSVYDALPDAEVSDIPVYTWNGQSVEEDEYSEQFEQPAGPAVGGWISTGFDFGGNSRLGAPAVTHWMHRRPPAPPPHSDVLVMQTGGSK